MRTKPEIDDQIKRLEAVRGKVPATTLFGDDNEAAIDAQIEVLKDLLDSDGIYDKWEEEEENLYSRDSALEAYDWLHERTNYAPAAGWEELAAFKSK